MPSKSRKIYQRSRLSKKVKLSYSEINENLDDILLKKLVKLYEGKCHKEGYFKKNSIKIIQYSTGDIKRNDVVDFAVLFDVEICYPVENQKLNVIVKNITKAGIRATLINDDDDPLVVFIMRDHYNKSDYFNQVEVNNKIDVNIIGTRHELNDIKMYVIAELIIPKTLKK